MDFTVSPAVIELNNREIAFTFWLGVLVLGGVVFMVWTDGISALWGILRLLMHPLLLGLIIFLATWSAGQVWLGASIGLWRWELLQGTVVWFMGSALVLLFNMDKIEKDPDYLRHRAVALVGWTGMLTYATNLATLPLVYEISLQPMLAGLALMSVSGRFDEGRQRVGRLAGISLGLIGVGLLGHAGVHLALHPSEWSVFVHLRALLLPVWMTLGLLPAVYALAVVFAYDGARRHIRRDSPSRRATGRALLALVAERIVCPDEVSHFRLYWARQVAIANSLDEARRIVRGFRSDRLHKELVQAAKAERLRTFAGVVDTNTDGVPLDQREFEETRSALRWLSTSQMGWFRRENRYREEPFGYFIERLIQGGLTDAEDVQCALAEDGQSWWASRRTVSGWALGSGANASPPNEWHFEGPGHPDGFPGEARGWRSV